MSNSGPDLSVSRLIVVNIEEKEYHFIVQTSDCRNLYIAI